VKAPAFDYQAPESVEEALALIGEFGDDARLRPEVPGDSLHAQSYRGQRSRRIGHIGPPAAIANAIEYALSPFGGEVREFPVTQDRIWQLISNATSSGSSTGAGVNE
jgi:hypothetical protein